MYVSYFVCVCVCFMVNACIVYIHTNTQRQTQQHTHTVHYMLFWRRNNHSFISHVINPHLAYNFLKEIFSTAINKQYSYLETSAVALTSIQPWDGLSLACMDFDPFLSTHLQQVQIQARPYCSHFTEGYHNCLYDCN